MSIDYYAQAVFGFKAEFIERFKKGTRFDVKTGEPYEVEEFSHYDLLLDDKIVESNLEETTKSYKGMEFFESGYFEGQLFLGLPVANCDENKDHEVIEYRDLKKSGAICDLVDTGLTPRLYLIFGAS